MADNDEDETDHALEAFLALRPGTGDEFDDPRLALARGCLIRSMSSRQVAKIRANRSCVVVFQVRQSWEAWVGKAAAELFPGRQLFIPTLTRKGEPNPDDPKRLAEAIAKHSGVLAIVPEGTAFPERMSHLPDARITVVPPDLPVLREVARRCLTGDARRIRSVPPESDLDALAACFSPGSPVASAIARLGRLQSPPVKGTGAVPPLSSVCGLEAAKAWGIDLKADIAAYRAGELPFSAVDAGAVLAGPPGVGKTMVARIIAAECKLAFVSTSIGELFATSDGDLGAVIRRARQIFSQARAAAPSLLFIDELDALPSRSTLNARGKDWWTPVITEFLTQLDSSLTDREGVVVLGATNRYADLDPALVRPGRLARLLEIIAPSAEDLAGIFRHHLRQDLVGVDLFPLAKEVAGASGAQAADWIHVARRIARNAGRALEIGDLWDAAIGRETRSPERLRRIAVHEAGHCLVGHLVGLTPDHVTIRRHGDRGGTTTFLPAEPPMTHADAEKLVLMLLAGVAAEAVLLGEQFRSLGSGGPKGSDLHLATELIAAGHVAHGVGGTLLWRATPDKATALLSSDPVLRRNVDADLQRLAKTAERLVTVNRPKCERLAAQLLEETSLSRDDLVCLLDDRHA
jgi:SpoVK/Ycf46/Vps4 family AAA+-type ATPase